MSHHGTYGSPWDLHTTRMPMIHHGACAQLGCRWLPIGLKLNSNTDGSRWDLHSANSVANDSPRDINSIRMPMAHHGTYTQHARMPTAHYGTYTQLEYRWPSIELSHNTGADGSPWDLHSTRMPVAHHKTYLHPTGMPMAHHRTYTLHGCRWLTMGLTHITDANGSP